MIPELICILLAIAPTDHKLYHDRKGEVHPDRVGIITVVVLMILASYAGSIIAHRDFLRVFGLSGGFFVAFFPYLVNIVESHDIPNHKVKWWDHLSTTAWPDRLSVWKNLHWSVRMILVGLLFAGSVWFYLGYFVVFE